jgi:hypothetical protein
MRSMLRNLFLVPAMMAAMASTAALAATTRIEVPFSFTAGGKICPAGKYVVTLDSTESVLSLRALDTSISLLWGAGPGDPAPNSNKVALQFDRLGDGYTLRSVQFRSKSTSRLDKKPKHGEQAPARTVEGL